MSKTFPMVSISLAPADAEVILQQYAETAARYGSLGDYITRKTVDAPGSIYLSAKHYDEAKREWHEKFLRAKRIVEAFGVECQYPTEAETLGVYIPSKVLKSHLVKVAGMTFEHVDKSAPDPKNSRPRYKGRVHAEACRAAADRVVANWKLGAAS